MFYVRLALFVICTLSFPRAWHAIIGVSANQFSRNLTIEREGAFEPKVLDVFSQPFDYYGKGSQFNVWISRDRRVVLKIPRSSKTGEALLDHLWNRHTKKPSVVKSLQIASDGLSKETAVIYAHYGARCSLPVVFLNDRLHRLIPIDLSSHPFVLQEKKQLFGSALASASGNEAKRILAAYLDLISREKERGFMSKDRAFWLNFGYEEGTVWRIDVGSYVPIDGRFSFQKAAKPLSRYLRDADPSLYAWFQNELIKREMGR
jgi:hypothetical protein